MARPTPVLIFSAFMIVFLWGCGESSSSGRAARAAVELASILPAAEDLDGVVSADEYREYGREQLFEYMNGGAEIYLALNFSKVGVREYLTALGRDIYITIEAFDMGAAEDARAIFLRSRPQNAASAGIGEESAMGGGALEFLHGRFFFRIRCDDMGPEVDRLLRSSGQTICDRLGNRA